jgi:hypothetical protein
MDKMRDAPGEPPSSGDGPLGRDTSVRAEKLPDSPSPDHLEPSPVKLSNGSAGTILLTPSNHAGAGPTFGVIDLPDAACHADALVVSKNICCIPGSSQKQAIVFLRRLQFPRTPTVIMFVAHDSLVVRRQHPLSSQSH